MADKVVYRNGVVAAMFWFWLVVTIVLSFFIPHYDFGFDGIKVWLLLSGLTMILSSGVVWILARSKT